MIEQIDKTVCPHCGNLSEVVPKNKSGFCSRKCLFNYVDPDTGISKIEISKKKRFDKMSQVDPKTGLTGFESQQLKRKKTMSQVDPESGLTGFEINSQKGAVTMSQVNPESGLTGHQRSEVVRKKTMSQVDPESGLTGFEINSQKGAVTMSQVNPESGLTGYQKSRIKCFETMSQVDPESGLTGYQKKGLTQSNTLNFVNNCGLTIAKEISIKTKKTMSQVDPESGLTGYQKLVLKGIKSRRINVYNKKKNIFPREYRLLTTKEEYVKSDNNILKYSCNECSSIRESYWPYIRCIQCYPYNRSMGENEVLEFCKSLVSNVQSNPRQIIKPLELDIYLPNHHLAIEYNGVYWHSSDSVETENKDYHLHKTQECASKGIQLFHIFENEWQDPQKQKIWKSIISNRLGKSTRIFARKTEVKPVTSVDTREFLNSNHLQGSCVSSVNLGLYLDDMLVSIMTFGKSRYDKSIDWELLRFCNVLGTLVVGGASKLLKMFTRYNKGNIISYADKRRSNGNLYERLGFRLSHESGPNYFYWKDQGLESRIRYQKHKLSKLLEEYDEELTETQNMYNNGYRKIYDCGSQVWLS